jgi:hypothetical protein
MGAMSEPLSPTISSDNWDHNRLISSDTAYLLKRKADLKFSASAEVLEY